MNNKLSSSGLLGFLSTSIETLCRPPRLKKYLVLGSSTENPKKYSPNSLSIIFFCLTLLLGGLSYFIFHVNPLQPQIKQFINLKAPCPDFSGRERYLNLLHKDLLQHHEGGLFRNRMKMKVLWGKGGYGKSEIAIEFANRFISKFSFIWTIYCDSQENIDRGYRNLAEILRISENEDVFGSIREKVHFYLENTYFPQPWLLIFDNVEKEFTDYPQRGGVILITSQRKLFNPEYLLEVEPFSFEESLELLQKITKEKRSEAMIQLAKDLAGIPLLINYVANYIKVTPGSNIEEYYKTFSTHLMEKEGPLWNEMDVNRRYLKSLAASWEFPLKSLSEENIVALEWLYVCSFMNPEHIPEEWIDDILPASDSAPLRRKEILTALQSYGIIRYEENEKAFSLHRFFQHMIRESRKEQRQHDISKAICILSKHAKNKNFGHFTSWKEGELWSLHATEVIKQLQHLQIALSTPQSKQQAAELYEGIAKRYVLNGKYKEALVANTQVLAFRQLLADCHGIGKAYEALAETCFKMGKYSEALMNCNKAGEILSRLPSSGGLDYAATLNTKGLTLWEQGKYEEGLACHQKALQIRENHLGPFNMYVGYSLNNAALCYREAGRYLEAQELCEKALETYQKSGGKEHPWYCWALQNKAWITFYKEDYKSALQLFKESLYLDGTIRGKNHECIAFHFLGIGWCQLKMGKIREAKKSFRKAYINGRKFHGREGRGTLRSYRGLGWAYIKDHRYEKGLRMLMNQVQISYKVYYRTPKLLRILEDFNSALTECQDKDVPQELLQQAYDLTLKIHQENVGPFR